MALQKNVLQGSANPQTPGLVNFVTAVAYHVCLKLPREFLQPGKHSCGDSCLYLPSLPYSHHAICYMAAAALQLPMNKDDEPRKGPSHLHALDSCG